MMPVKVDVSAIEVKCATRVECSKLLIILTRDGVDRVIELEFDCSHKRHCVESYFADDTDDELFSTRDRQKNTIALTDQIEFNKQFKQFCVTFATWLADSYAKTELEWDKATKFFPKNFFSHLGYYDNASLKFQTDSNLDQGQSFHSFWTFCESKSKSKHVWKFHCFPIKNRFSIELDMDGYKAFKNILRFLGYMKVNEAQPEQIPQTAISRCREAVAYLKKRAMKGSAEDLRELDLWRQNEKLSAAEIAYLLYCYDSIEMFIKLKQLLTSEQIVKFAFAIKTPDLSHTEIMSRWKELQELFDHLK